MACTARYLILLMVAVFFSISAVEAFVVTRSGSPACEVVIADDATAPERFAAGELVDYVEKISGAVLQISRESEHSGEPAIFVGQTEAATAHSGRLDGAPSDSFVISIGDDVLLFGDCSRSTLYAVYELLEREMGCRFLAPGPLWEDIPGRGTITLDETDRTCSPGIRYRFNRMTVDAPTHEFYPDVLDWAVKHRINIGAGFPDEDASDNVVKRGGFRAHMHPHIIHRLLPTEEYFQEHPEWYALVNGERKDLNSRTQLCTTNPEVIAIVAEKISALFDDHPDLEFFGLGQADGTAFCECERCTALDTGEMWSNISTTKPVITERWLTFVNAVAKKLQQTHPDKKIYTLAYHQTVRPPDPEVIRPEPNVMIQLVNSRPNYVCFVHRFEKDGCTHHARFRDVLDRWIDMTPAGVTIYEYVQHSTFAFMPFAAPHKFAADINYLADAGVVGYEAQSNAGMWGVYGITHYAVARSLWNPNLDPDALVEDYCDHAFKHASEPMQKFYATLEQGLEDAECITRGIWTYMTPEVMTEARKHLDAAHDAADRDIVKDRLATIEVSFTLGERGSAAWWKAQKAYEDADVEALQEAITEGEELMEWVGQQQRDPEMKYHVGTGKLKVQVNMWQQWLKALEQ